MDYAHPQHTKRNRFTFLRLTPKTLLGIASREIRAMIFRWIAVRNQLYTKSPGSEDGGRAKRSNKSSSLPRYNENAPLSLGALRHESTWKLPTMIACRNNTKEIPISAAIQAHKENSRYKVIYCALISDKKDTGRSRSNASKKIFG